MTVISPTELVHESMPLCATLGITASECTAERVVLHLEWRPELCTTGDLMHGGVIMSLADSAGAACAFMNLPDDSVGTTTVEAKTNFLRGVQEGATLTATSTPLHVGRSTIVVETELRLHTGKLVAKTSQTQTVLR